MDNLYKKVLQQTPNKILCIGKNYFDHVVEMGGNQYPKEPIIFQKPLTTLFPVQNNNKWYLPNRDNEIHHETELGFLVSKLCKNVKKNEWQEYVGGYFLALDLTDRDMQAKAKKSSAPWDLSKGQDNFCPISEFIPKEKIIDPYNLDLNLKINGKIVQQDNTKNMHFKIGDFLEYVTQYITLYPGDLVLTGTPSGVGPIKEGDHLEAKLIQNETVVAQFELNILKSKI